MSGTAQTALQRKWTARKNALSARAIMQDNDPSAVGHRQP